LKISTSEALMNVSTYFDFFTGDERPLAVGSTDESSGITNRNCCGFTEEMCNAGHEPRRHRLLRKIDRRYPASVSMPLLNVSEKFMSYK
jgi:hypothetical protein